MESFVSGVASLQHLTGNFTNNSLLKVVFWAFWEICWNSNSEENCKRLDVALIHLRKA